MGPALGSAQNRFPSAVRQPVLVADDIEATRI